MLIAQTYKDVKSFPYDLIIFASCTTSLPHSRQMLSWVCEFQENVLSVNEKFKCFFSLPTNEQNFSNHFTATNCSGHADKYLGKGIHILIRAERFVHHQRAQRLFIGKWRGQWQEPLQNLWSFTGKRIKQAKTIFNTWLLAELLQFILSEVWFYSPQRY
jgi:hypothetical protein